jgi:hypothetical protein
MWCYAKAGKRSRGAAVMQVEATVRSQRTTNMVLVLLEDTREKVKKLFECCSRLEDAGKMVQRSCHAASGI